MVAAADRLFEEVFVSEAGKGNAMRAVPTDKEIMSFAAGMVNDKKDPLPWQGFLNDDNGEYTIPLVTSPMCKLIRAMLAAAAPAPVGDGLVDKLRDEQMALRQAEILSGNVVKQAHADGAIMILNALDAAALQARDEPVAEESQVLLALNTLHSVDCSLSAAKFERDSSIRNQLSIAVSILRGVHDNIIGTRKPLPHPAKEAMMLTNSEIDALVEKDFVHGLTIAEMHSLAAQSRLANDAPPALPDAAEKQLSEARRDAEQDAKEILEIAGSLDGKPAARLKEIGEWFLRFARSGDER